MRAVFATASIFATLIIAATALAMPVAPAPVPSRSPVLVQQSNGETHTVRGYWRKDGTWVPPHRQTDPDANKFNNFSTDGNTNPFTGEKGTVNPTKKKIKTAKKPTAPTKPKMTTTKTAAKKKPTTLNPALPAKQTTTTETTTKKK
ncbi:MAG: hypothetical protein HY246_17455 [Proteobacteria bacterium]|nr:hypothetical protein [Pseudomonadota bacterium]